MSQCQYTTQGFYMCSPVKKEEQQPCKTDNTLKYIAADNNYDMHVRSMLYQLRVTQDGYRNYISTNKST
jgi:hypothetical protein